MPQFQVIDDKAWTGITFSSRTGDLPLIHFKIIETELVERTVGRIECSFCADIPGGVIPSPDIASRTGYRATTGKRRDCWRSCVDQDTQSILIGRRAGIEI